MLGHSHKVQGPLSIVIGTTEKRGFIPSLVGFARQKWERRSPGLYELTSV